MAKGGEPSPPIAVSGRERAAAAMQRHDGNTWDAPLRWIEQGIQHDAIRARDANRLHLRQSRLRKTKRGEHHRHQQQEQAHGVTTAILVAAALPADAGSR
jgi:hypothetical protein